MVRARDRWSAAPAADVAVHPQPFGGSVGEPHPLGDPSEGRRLEELAALAGVHPTHLLRTFRRYQGATIAIFVRRRRIERARTEVAQAKRPLSMIALDAGFADQSHFTRVFKRAFGETPGQYARSLKGGK
jgi:AraC family transcriptional regulator